MAPSLRPHSDGSPRGVGYRARLAAADGVTLIEVLASCLLVGLIALSLVGLDAVGRTTADQRRRTQAVQVAQQDQERLAGLSADQIATLNQTRTVTLDGVAFTVTSTGQFLSSSAGSASCSSTAAAADYAKVVSTVDWASNRRSDVVEQSIVTPRAGGSLLTQVVDQDAVALPGVRVAVAGTDQNTDTVRRTGTTDTGGCTIFGALLVGDYAVNPTLAGYVDKDGDFTPSTAVTTTAGNTATARFTMGRAGSATASSFRTFVTTGVPVGGQTAPSLSWNNSQMATPGTITPTTVPTTTITSPTTLFPFFVTTPGTYNGNYTLWAGKCASALPPTAQSPATVAPGTAGSAVVTEPALKILVTYAGSAVKPAHIELTDSCGQNWQPSINTATGPAAPAAGWLRFPGQPYGTSYSICADFFVTSLNASRKITLTAKPNTDMTQATTYTVPITSSSGTGLC